MIVHPDTWTLPEIFEGLAPDDAAAVLEDLIASFQMDTARRLEHVRSCIGGPDRATMRAEVHAIKGSAGQMGAHAMEAYCREIEPDLLHVSEARLAECVRALELHFLTACRAMRAHSGGLP